MIRSFRVFGSIISPLSDASRSNVIKNFFNLLQSPQYWLIGGEQTLITPDSGPYLILANFGMFALILFVIIFFLLIKSSNNIQIRIYLGLIFSQFALSSETIFIPRYIILVTWSFAVLFLTIKLSSITSKKY